jgi:uncharacterized protein
MPAKNKTHEALVADWKANAESHDERNYRFLRSLKMRPEKKVDRIALELHQEAFSIVDCTKCANCCRTMRIIFSEEDVTRIAAHLGMPRDEFVATFLEPDDEDPAYHAKATPCPFLGSDNLCTIYDVRPNDCREYPFTDKPGFASRTIGHAENALTCPAVFHVVEEMKIQLGR